MIDELIHSHIRYAHAIAAQLARKISWSLTRADLEGAALLGLVQAARSYDPSQKASFATFAYYRVRGAVLDEMRKSWRDSNPRGMNEGAEVQQSVESDTFAYASLERNTSSQADLHSISLTRFPLERIPDSSDGPANQLLRKEELETVFNVIRTLPNRHRFVLESYYCDELSLVSISRELKLSKSRVSRIRTQALSMVRELLKVQCKPSHIPRANANRQVFRQLCANGDR